MLRLAKLGLIFQHVARTVIFSENFYEKHILRINATLPKLDVAIIYVSVREGEILVRGSQDCVFFRWLKEDQKFVAKVKLN